VRNRVSVVVRDACSRSAWTGWQLPPALTIGTVQPNYRCLRASLLDDIEHQLVLFRELRASLQSVGALVVGEQAAGRVEISLHSTKIDLEHLFQVVDDNLRIDSGRRRTGRSRDAIGIPWGERALHVELVCVYWREDI
jgi:hypothetical protein